MITAQQAIKTFTEEDQTALAAAEKRIDAALSLYEGRPILVDFNGTSTRRKVLEKLCAMYGEGGWIAVIKSGDQRDPGPWIEFTIASPPRSGPGQR